MSIITHPDNDSAMKLYTQRLIAEQHRQQTQDDTADAAMPTLALNYDMRQKSRFKATLDSGEVVGIDLPRTEVLRAGAVIATEQGDKLRIIAAAQTVMQVKAKSDSETAHFDLMRAAYHLGNRHVPLMLTKAALYFEPDHVLADMLLGLGVLVETVEHPFEPETGAYAGHSHSHHHSHRQLHSHGHGHGHGHGHHPAHPPDENFHPQDLIKANFTFMG